MTATDAVIATWFGEHRAFLWGLSYRLTGSAADADDVVQDTFVRACKHAPNHLDDPRRWLMRVAINLGRDVLRRRKRRGYVGTWLPTPVDSDKDSAPSFEPVVEGGTLEGRYDVMESASLAFLQALEALTPTQRAVLLLRDVFDYSAAEVASALATSEGNVRTVHHRARRAMHDYEGRRVLPTPVNRARTARVLQRFVKLLAAHDVRGIERLLAADVKAATDGGGEVTASLTPIVGVERVARFFARLAGSRTGRIGVAYRSINQFPAAIFDFEPQAAGRRTQRLLLSVDVGPTGLIQSVRVIANSAKLAALPSTRARTLRFVTLRDGRAFDS